MPRPRLVLVTMDQDFPASSEAFFAFTCGEAPSPNGASRRGESFEGYQGRDPALVLPSMLVAVLPSALVPSADQSPSSFRSLISFREVLDPASKAAVLSVDSQVQMRGMIDSELQVRSTSSRPHAREAQTIPWAPMLQEGRGVPGSPHHAGMWFSEGSCHDPSDPCRVSPNP